MCWAIPAALPEAWSVLSTSRSPLYWSSYKLYTLEWGVCISSTFLVTQSQFPWKPLYWKSKLLPSGKFMCFPHYFKRLVFLSQHWFGLKEIGNNVMYLCAAFKWGVKSHSCFCVCCAWVFGYIAKKEWIQSDLSASRQKEFAALLLPMKREEKALLCPHRTCWREPRGRTAIQATSWLLWETTGHPNTAESWLCVPSHSTSVGGPLFITLIFKNCN